MNKDTIRNFLRNGATTEELIAECTTSTLRDWNPAACEYGSAGYIEADEGDAIDLHDEASVSAYIDDDTGAIMIGSNGEDAEAEESTRYGVAELAALIDLRDQIDDEDQIDYIDGIVRRRGLDAILEHFGLEIVSSSELPNAHLLDDDPTVKTYADYGVKDQTGTVTVAYTSTSGNTICTWGQTTTDDDGNTVLEGFAGEDIEDLLAIQLL